MNAADPQAEDDELLAPLALALVDQPRATLQELARAVGISKATLYRHCRTREELVARLLDHGTEVVIRAIQAAGLDSAPPLTALKRLIANNLEQRELAVFLLHYCKDQRMDPDTKNLINVPLDAFFLRGQQEGLFRIDIPAPALTEIWNFLWVGLVEAERRGRVARACLPDLILTTFLDGARAPQAQG